MTFVDKLASLFLQRGAALYESNRPDGVSQLAHALQTAAQAEQASADDELVSAALLHDIGHLLREPRSHALAEDRDDLHQYFALPFLRPWFGEAVLAPIRLHVDAKRFLCATEPDYRTRLSPASVRSLALQGGPFAPAEVDAFLEQPYAQEAVTLRRWDEGAKQPGAEVPAWSHYVPMLGRALRARAEASRPLC
ncbi:MAG: phosphonate degradation HD-domain oxygenase [Caldimonas sp.]